jgi:uncharacterized membrane protein
MLNEKKIRLMKDLAVYESGKGAEELKICEYYRSDYISVNSIAGVIWITVGYVIFLALTGICAMDYLMEHFTMDILILVGIGALAGYIGILVFYIIMMHVLYGYRYDHAKEGVKHYKYRLMKLGEMYKKGERSHE